MTASLRILWSKADSNTWESFTRSELKLESVHQESPCSDIFRKRDTKPLLKQKHRQKHLTWDKEKNNWTVAQCPKSSFQMKVNFAFNLEIKVQIGEAQNPCCLKSVWWFGLLWLLLVLVRCVFWSPKSMQPSTRTFWSTLCFRLLYGDADLMLQNDFSTCPQCQNHFQVLTMILLCLIGQLTCLTWTTYHGINGIFLTERWETVDPKI